MKKLLADLEGEIWKDIAGYEGKYVISSMGRVKSLERRSKRANNSIPVTEKILHPTKGSNGYLGVKLSNGKKMTNNIHVLVANAFIPKKIDKKDINHKNGIKTDNRLSNLERVSRGENVIHALRMGLKYEKTGGERHTAKPVILLHLLTGVFEEFTCIMDCAKYLGTKASAISRTIKLNRIYKRKYKIELL